MREEIINLAQVDRIADCIRDQISIQPKIGLILGSGLGTLANSTINPVTIPTSTLPNWPVSTVPGHVGNLIIGELEDHPVFIMQGRSHFYEGYSMSQVGLPIRVMQRLGIEILIVTNAAGAIHPDYEPGDLMLITDHINLIGMAGQNPLRGPNLEELGPRFPDMSRVYDRSLLDLARSAAKSCNISLHEGVYICLAGPSFETPADLKFLKAIGADAVGMSTIPEVITARHGGQRVLAISGISNKANLNGTTITTHEEVLEAGKIIVPKMAAVLRDVLKHLHFDKP